MQPIENLDSKRICDISMDGKVIVIRKKDCTTIITANPNGTLRIQQQKDH